MPLKLIKTLIFYTSLIASIFLAISHQTQTLGKISIILLTVVIFTKPAVKLFPTIGFFKILLALRRELGQATAFAVIGHVLAQIFPGGNLFELLFFAATGGPKSFQFWGFWGLILILPLFLTSNDLSTRILKRNWFLLHKLIHPLYIFALIHYGLQKGPLVLTLCLLALIALYLSRYLASRGVTFFNSPPPPPVI